MAKKDDKKKTFELVHPADAVSQAFGEIDDLECINMEKGKRVEDALSSNSLSADLMLGGGYKPGFMGTVFGPEGSGKSTLMLEHIVAAQNANIPICMYDPESGSDPVYMRSIGIDLKYKITVTEGKKRVKKPGFFYTQPETGEAVYRHILQVLARMPTRDHDGPPRILFVIDSFAGMGSEEVDQVGDGGRIADEARMHSYFLKRVVPRLRRRGALLLGTNQTRTAIGTYGGPQNEAGGGAIRFWAGVKIRTSRKRVESDKIGVQTLPVIWRTTKNKAFVPFKSTEMRLMLGRGIDKAFDAFYFLKNLGLIETRKGKHKILLDGHGKVLSWKEFRYVVENPSFRQECFEMLKQGPTWRRYFEHAEDLTYTYDEDYQYGDDIEPTMAELEDAAAEYEEIRKKRRKQGKRPAGKSKKQDHTDLDFDALTGEEDD
jgi:recombination protein RecA